MSSRFEIRNRRYREQLEADHQRQREFEVCGAAAHALERGVLHQEVLDQQDEDAQPRPDGSVRRLVVAHLQNLARVVCTVP